MLTQVAKQLMGSSEFKEKYDTLTNHKFEEAMFPQVFGRAPDTARLKYWVDKLNAKTTTYEKMMIGFNESPEIKDSFKAKVLAVIKF